MTSRGAVLRRAVIFGGPFLVYLAALVHPKGLDAGERQFLVFHLAFPLLVCLLAWTLLLLVDGLGAGRLFRTETLRLHDRFIALIGSYLDGAVTDGAFRYAGAPAGVSALAFRARVAPDTLRIADLTAMVGTAGAAPTPVRATLLATRFADPLVRFTIDGDVDLAALSPLIADRDTRLSGRAKLAVRGHGPARDPGA